MRILLIIAVTLIGFTAELIGQSDFKTLDRQSYNYFMKGDYKNLKKVADTMKANGIDYYYLRLRLGILAYNKQLYPSALIYLKKAIDFNSLDTVSGELIYKSYLLSGRRADANLYLESVPLNVRTNILKKSAIPVSSEFYVGSSFSANDVVLYSLNSLNYEAVKNSLSITAGGESYFLNRFRGTYALTNFRKSETVYSPSDPAGTDLNYVQNQIYAKLTGSVFPGWDFSAFGHIALYSEVVKVGLMGKKVSTNKQKSEYLAGAGISKNGWRIRGGANISFSNFGNSTQIRGEGYFTWLPSGNLNLYLTSGWMGQTDTNWGGTYQASQEVGFKILKSLWMETGMVMGNSFLYARNQGYMMYNSFQIPALTIYSNLLILPWKHFNLSVTPYYSQTNEYSWDLNAYARTNKLTNNVFGGSIKLTYKH